MVSLGDKEMSGKTGVTGRKLRTLQKRNGNTYQAFLYPSSWSTAQVPKRYWEGKGRVTELSNKELYPQSADTTTHQVLEVSKTQTKAFVSMVFSLQINYEVGKNCNIHLLLNSVQFSSVAQSWPTLCKPMECSTPGFPVCYQLPELAQTHIHRVSDAIQPSHPLSSPSPLAPNPSQHQSLFQWVNSSHEVAKVLEFQL